MSATATVPRAPEILRRDFPAWIPPMLVKELRQGLRTRGFVGTLVGFQLLMALAMMLTAFPTGGGAMMATAFFWVMISVQLLMVTPARALGGLQGEADSRTLDLLLLTRLDAVRIVLGKWVSLLVQTLLFLVTMLPYWLVRYFIGGIDLGSEAKACGVLLFLAMLLAAAGLWAASFGRVLRWMLIVAGLLVSQAWSAYLLASFGISGFTGVFGAVSSGGGAAPWLAFYDLSLVLVFFLLNAIRNVAPAAANFAPHARLVPLLGLLPLPLMAMVGATTVLRDQLVVTGVMLALVCSFELARDGGVMVRHWRPWGRHGPLVRIVGRGLMPGWESALWFSATNAMLWSAAAMVFLPKPVSSGMTAPHFAWIAFLAFAGLVFPAVLLSFIRVPGVSRPAAYFVTLAGVALLGGLLAKWGGSAPRWAMIATVADLIPVANVFGTFDPGRLATGKLIAQGAISGVILGFGFGQARGYLRTLASITAEDRRIARETGIMPS